ncbi:MULTISPECIES: hypothetical protein [Arthrobacter]|uniref:hypothetical protein n=1 Tax=Arthrobacter TaxID=1663 RepID=UPI000830368A|nr:MULTISPECIES: hypothetical protein [Arthrobacter]UPO76744.1 hypothetical protein ArtHe_15620 [Arthrobacter sp. Helios]
MEHTLRVLVRIDTKSSSAGIEVRGCLVPANCPDLVEILRHTATLGAHMVLNLTKALHLDASALDELLLQTGQVPCLPLDGGHTTVSVRLPSRLPSCAPRVQVPDWNPLSNAQAFELAFQQHDPAALRSARRPG